MKKRCRVTLKEVAQSAGVSVATVSMVLNGKNSDRITDKTIKKVLQAAAELNYTPDLNAQILKGKASTLIGLVIPDISNPFYPEITKGITDRAAELGYNVTLFNTDNNITQEIFAMETLSAMRVAGVILCGVFEPSNQERGLLRYLEDRAIPVVRIDRYDSDEIVPYVAIDNYAAAYQAMEYLIRSGHRRIAVITPDMSLHIIHERIRGIYTVCAQYGLGDYEKFIIYSGVKEMQKADVPSVVDQIVQLECTAVFSLLGDLFAIECIREMETRGISVPDDISVVGFDDIQLATFSHPRLTSVHQPKYDMGKAALDLLCSVMGGEIQAPYRIIMEHRLIVRESVRLCSGALDGS